MKKGKLAKELFYKGYNCAQAITIAFKEELNLDEDTLSSISSSFGGGISRLREVCGCISAMAIILGKLYGNYDVLDNNAKAKHYVLIQKLANQFNEEFNSINCAVLLNKVKKVEAPIPEVRNEEYYKNRPCGKYIEFMANLIEKEINNHE